MERITKKDYVEIIKIRKKRSRVYYSHQFVGLKITRYLDDEANKKLYMRLAKEYDSEALLRLARDVMERRSVKNRGAYFMRMFQLKRKEGGVRRKLLPKKKKQMKIKLKRGLYNV